MRKEVKFVLDVWQLANRLNVKLMPALVDLFVREFHITRAEFDAITRTFEQETFAHYQDDPRMLSALKRLKEEWKP